MFLRLWNCRGFEKGIANYASAAIGVQLVYVFNSFFRMYMHRGVSRALEGN